MNTLKIAKQIPFKVLLKRVLKRALPAQRKDYTGQEFRTLASDYTLKSLLNIKLLPTNAYDDVVKHYLKHEFDLLGSGWVSRNAKNELELIDKHSLFAQKMIQEIAKNYQFIDWQLDVKSGFRFAKKKQFNEQTPDKSRNVDIKNCWELGRLQHLPQMALAAKHSQYKEELIVEFKNQSLDFILSNPIGMGVQWACAMDVGIRASNWLVAYDLFKQIDEENILNKSFQLIFIAYIHKHARFLMRHLEQKEGAAGNHYLFNLVGLLFISNYLSEKEESLAWRKFAEAEIEKEFFKQFFADGGNFEGSTTYHCLSAEAMLYATALILRNEKDLPTAYVGLLVKSYQFIKDVIKPNGEMPQFGDNDSGRLFIFNPTQNLLKYNSLLSGFSGLFIDENESAIERMLIQQLSKNKKIAVIKNKEKKKVELEDSNHQLKKPNITTIKFDEKIDVNKVQRFTYDEFGLYVFKSAAFYLAISAISNKKMHHSWGHVHNDKLSFVLQVNGIDLVKDPGTYSYTAFPKKRMDFRATGAHNGIVVKGIEQNKSIGLFYLERETICKVLIINDLLITLQVNYYGVQHIREFKIAENELIITDYCNKPFSVNINKFEEYSPKYGVIT